MKPMKKAGSKGFTLIEMILVLALIGIIITVAFSFMIFGNHTFGMTNRQYEVQSDVRLAVDYINRQVRFSTDIDLLDTVPSPADSDDYDYIYIDSSGDIIHSKYNGGSIRGEKTVVSELVTAGSYFVSEEDGTSLGVVLKSSREGQPGDIQDYDITSGIELPNIVLNERVFASGHTAAKTIKFKVDTSLTAATPSSPSGTGAPTPSGAAGYVNVTIVIKTPANNNRDFKVILDGVEMIPVKTANKTYTADFGSFLTNTSHTLIAQEESGGTYTTFYTDNDFDVSDVDLVEEISAP